MKYQLIISPSWAHNLLIFFQVENNLEIQKKIVDKVPSPISKHLYNFHNSTRIPIKMLPITKRDESFSIKYKRIIKLEKIFRIIERIDNPFKVLLPFQKLISFLKAKKSNNTWRTDTIKVT